jgi:3-dehydroquinate synthase
MNMLTVTTSTTTYPVIVESGALTTLPHRLKELGLNGVLWLVSDSAVAPLYGTALAAQLQAAGYTVYSYTVPAGEQSKRAEQLAALYDWLIAGGVERRDTLLALGGGVIGDLVGFAAATVLRGIHLVQLPTTLQGMVDAAVGGKTGINHPLGKNLIGAFYQPRMVLADTATLATLPPRELRAGWAEVIKHGVIRDAVLFQQLESKQAAQSDWDMASLVRQAVAVKVAVVNADERELGERIILNYGHTVGHAIEAAAGYGRLLHGEAVAIGMHIEARIAEAIGACHGELVARQQRLLEAYGLSTTVPTDLAIDELMALMLRDKKVQGKRVRWVLPTAIGQVVVRDDVPVELVRKALQS